MKRILYCAAFFASLVVLAIPAIAQSSPTDMNLDTGIKPWEVYDHAQENVNIQNGNLNIKIPLVHLPGRNGHDLDVSLTYNSQNWTPTAYLSDPPSDNYDVSVGWSYASSDVSIGSTGWQLNVPVLYASGVWQWVNGAPGGGGAPDCAVLPPGSSGCGEPPQGVSSYGAVMCWSNFVLVLGDGAKYSFGGPTWGSGGATLGCTEQLTTCSQITGGDSGGDTCTDTVQEEPNDDRLIAYDEGSEEGDAGGEGIMLDLTNVAGGTGTGSAVVRLPDGSQIDFPFNSSWGATPTGQMYAAAGQLVDSNGNVISTGLGGITDALGRTVTFNGIPGYGGPTGTIEYKDSTGTSRTITLNISQFANSVPPAKFTNPPANTAEVHQVTPDSIQNMLSSIVLPDGLAYTFQYNQYGEITEITYPSGGWTTYCYRVSPVQASYPLPVEGYFGADSRVVEKKNQCSAAVVPVWSADLVSGYVSLPTNYGCPNGVNKTTYARTNPPLTVDVTFPLGNQEVYTWPTSANERDVSVVDKSGSTLESTRTIYQGTLPSQIITTTPGNGLTSEVQYSYDASENQYTTSFYDRTQDFPYTLSAETDNLTSEKDYGFGANGSPGPLVKETDYTYLSQDLTSNPVNATDYLKWPIYTLKLKESETVKNGSGAQIAQTTYEYDNYESVITASGATQHGTRLNSYTTSYTTRGNVTAVSKWLNTTGATLTTRNYQFDDAGNVLIQKDPLGNSTTFSYADAWAVATCKPSSGNAAAYISQVTDALNEQTNYKWNSCTGTMASTTDPNNRSTSFSYDLMDRRVTANYPDGGRTSLQYSDTASSSSVLPIQIVTTKIMNSQNLDEISTTTLDGLSRVVQTELNSDPQGPDYVNTAYDGDGNVASVTNSFRGTSDPTYGVTQYQYDALGRKVIQTQQDGSVQQWCYDGVMVNTAQSNCSSNLGNQSTLGSWVNFSDESGNQWQRTTDALGRLIKVLEPSGTNLSPSLETDYVYDPIGNLLSVIQWGGLYGSPAPNGPITRSFTYDSLSQLVCASNPENTTAQCPTQASGSYVPGTTGYSYDQDENLHQKTFLQPNAAAGSAATVKTTYSYDPLNRVLSKSSNDVAATPTACYQYGLPSQTSGNLVGRLINEWTQSASANSGSCAATIPTSGTTLLTSKSILSYDPMGRISTEQTCVYPTCTTTTAQYPLAYTYDLVGDITSYTNGNNAIQFTQKYDGAGRLSSITSTSLPGDNYPSPLFSSPTYSPASGLTGATYGTGTGVTLCRWYDSRLRVTGETDTGGATQSSSTCPLVQPPLEQTQ